MKLPERCFTHMLEIVHYASSHKLEDHRVRDHLQRSFQNCSLLVEEFAPQGALEFYLNKASFKELLRKLFLSHELDEALSAISDHLRR